MISNIRQLLLLNVLISLFLFLYCIDTLLHIILRNYKSRIQTDHDTFFRDSQLPEADQKRS